MTKHSIDPRDTDGGITAATIENDIDWQKIAERHEHTIITLIRERDDEWANANAARDRAEQAEHFAGLWKEATRRTIRNTEHVQDLYAASLDGMEQRLRDTETDLEEESNNYLHARRQLEDAAKTIRELRGQLVEQETRGFTAEDPADAAVRWMIRAKEEQNRAEKAEARIKAVQDLIDQADTAGDWAVTCSRLQWAIDGTTPYRASETA